VTQPAVSRTVTDHDQFFKVLLREFIAEFFLLFFPDWAKRFDFTRVEWLDKELGLEEPTIDAGQDPIR
jgi:hypothetical protein